jgi:sugar O-acyltransferase (sialic acid O-acetyltransferase NeuD family)
MNRLVIFGTGDIAELAHYYFENDSTYDVVAFVVDDAFKKEDEFQGKPVTVFSEIRRNFPNSGFDVFVALSYSKMNAIRKEKYLQVKSAGYKLPSYISSRATILNNGEIGENCFILEDNTIQPRVKIGNNVTLWSGNHIGHHSVIGDHSFISSHVVISGGVNIEESVFIGVNATVRDHITIGELSLIGAGATIMKSTETESIYVANATLPAKTKSTQIRSI